tara:strand:- start:440 stop:1264 length:825 start_codon:yes stop_codon:yes gene_type:complete
VTEDRARQDTIKWENGSPYWGSDSTPISVEELRVVLKIIDSDISGNKATESLSNLDTKAHKEYTDSLKNILANPEVPIEEMNRDQLIAYNRTYDALEGIDTTYRDIGSSDYSHDRRKGESFHEASMRVDAIDNLLVESPQPLWTEEFATDLQKGLGSFRRPWIDDPLYEGISEGRKGFIRDWGRASNALGLGSESGRNVAEGVSNLNNFLTWLPRQANDRIQELFYNKLLGATEWQGGHGKKEKADRTRKMTGIFGDYELDPDSFMYWLQTLDQ